MTAKTALTSDLMAGKVVLVVGGPKDWGPISPAEQQKRG
jgi:hypothetical protein